MLLYVGVEVAFGSISLPRGRGKAGMGDSKHPLPPQQLQRGILIGHQT